MPIELVPANVGTVDISVPDAKRGRGRPKGSKNKVNTPRASIETSIEEEPIEPPHTPTSQLGTEIAIEDDAIEAIDIVTDTAEAPKKGRGNPKGNKNVKLKPDTPPPSPKPDFETDLETDHDEPPMSPKPKPKERRPQRRVAQVEYTPPTPPESPATRKRRVQSEYRVQQVGLHTARRERFSSLLDRFMT